MANLIQIKRSDTTAAPTTLANGEFGFTSNGNVLFIGANNVVVPIAGARNPGTLTANQALVANSSSAINKVIVANLVPTSIYANNTFGNAGQVLISNGSTVSWSSNISTIFVANLIPTSIYANGSFGANGQVLMSNGSTVNWLTPNELEISIDSLEDVTFLTAPTNNQILVFNANTNQWINSGVGNGVIFTDWSPSVKAANGILVDSGGVYVKANNGITVNANGVFAQGANGISITSAGINVLANTGVTSNSSGIFIGQPVGTTDSVTFQDINANGNTTLGSNTSDIVILNGRIQSDIIPSANVTYDIGSDDLRFDRIYGANGSFSFLEVVNDLTVNGDLIISGNLVTQNVSSLEVVDPLIKLAVNNETSDTLFIGFVGHYGPNTNHTGLFRSPDDNEYYLMGAYDDEASIDSNIIDITDPSFQLATMNMYINSGGLSTNATNLAITANGTFAVDFIGNTLTLSTELAAIYGGTGHEAYNTGDILVAANTTHLNRLSLAADGKVLQSNGTTLVYADLDGGFF